MVRESKDLRTAEIRVAEARDSVVIEVRDTLKEVTTVTVLLRQAQDPKDDPDTLKVSTVTDITRARARDRLRDVEVKVVEKHDTVFVERRDSVQVQKGPQANAGGRNTSTLVATLKWIFWILIAVGGLIILLKVGRVFKFFV